MNYRETLYRDYSANFSEQRAQAPKENQFEMYPRLYASSILPAKEATIGDLGCGRGEWLQWLSSLGYRQLHGIDMAASELALSLDDTSIKWQEGEVTPLLQSEENSEFFDLLHAKDLFEHFTKNEAVSFLQSCHQALKPGGELWIMTFNAQSPLSTATRYGDFTHENGITPNSMAQVLRACDFEIISVRGIHPHPSGLKGTLRHALFSLFEKTSSLLLRLRHGGAVAHSSVDSYSCSTDVFAIARKKISVQA